MCVIDSDPTARLSCLGSSVGKNVLPRCERHGFESHLKQLNGVSYLTLSLFSLTFSRMELQRLLLRKLLVHVYDNSLQCINKNDVIIFDNFSTQFGNFFICLQDMEIQVFLD